jgi:hypothetical protein
MFSPSKGGNENQRRYLPIPGADGGLDLLFRGKAPGDESPLRVTRSSLLGRNPFGLASGSPQHVSAAADYKPDWKN